MYLGETSVGFNLEAKRLQFRTLELCRFDRQKVNELIEQLSKAAVKGDQPLSFYVREVNDAVSGLHQQKVTNEQIDSILKACHQLKAINILVLEVDLDWPKILRTKKKLQRLCLEGSDQRQQYSFWSLFTTLTTNCPDIESISLGSQHYKEERGYPDTSTHRPCRKLQDIWINDEVWTIPYLKYLTVMAPNLVSVGLYLKSEKNMTKLKSTLEAAFREWSETLKTLCICHYHPGVSASELKKRQLVPITFPKMEKLEILVLIGVQISGASLYNLNSLKKLTLAFIDHRDIIHRLFKRSVLEKLTKLEVDEVYSYREVVRRRNDIRLNAWFPDCLYCGNVSGPQWTLPESLVL